MRYTAEPPQRPQTRHSSLVKVNKESKLKGRFTALLHTCKARLRKAGISVGCSQISHVTPQGAVMIRSVLCSSDIFLHDVPDFDLNLLHTFNTHQRFLRCSSYADSKFNTGCYRKCEIRNRKLAGPSLF